MKPQVPEKKKVDVPVSKAEKVVTKITESANAEDDVIMDIMKTKKKKDKKRKAKSSS